jgi:hypothetical protein
LPEGPRTEADVIFVLQLETDLITQLRRERMIDDRHRSCTPSQDTPIEIDLVRSNVLNLITIPRDHILFGSRLTGFHDREPEDGDQRTGRRFQLWES